MANQPGTGGLGKVHGTRSVRRGGGRKGWLGAAHGRCPLRRALPTGPTPTQRVRPRCDPIQVAFPLFPSEETEAGRAIPRPPTPTPIPIPIPIRIQPPQRQAALSGGGGHRAVLCPGSTVTLCPALPRGQRGNLPRCRLQLPQI